MEAALVILGVLIGIGYARSRPSGYRMTSRDRVLVALVTIAALTPAVALRATSMLSPDVATPDRIARFLAVVAIGAAPLSIFVLASWIRNRSQIES